MRNLINTCVRNINYDHSLLTNRDNGIQMPFENVTCNNIVLTIGTNH